MRFGDPEKSATILLIDDDPRALHLNSRALKEAGYRPVTATIGGSGFLFPARHQPALILLDGELATALQPIELAKLARQSYPDAKIVLISASTQIPGDSQRITDGFMHKQTPEAIAKAVGVWLQHFAAQGGSS